MWLGEQSNALVVKPSVIVMGELFFIKKRGNYDAILHIEAWPKFNHVETDCRFAHISQEKPAKVVRTFGEITKYATFFHIMTCRNSNA